MDAATAPQAIDFRPSERKSLYPNQTRTAPLSSRKRVEAAPCGSMRDGASGQPKGSQLHGQLPKRQRLGASAVQSNALYRKRKRHVIDEQMLQTLLREVDYDEAALGASNAV